MATGSEWVSELGQRDVRAVGWPQGVGGSGRGSGRRTTGSTLATGSEWVRGPLGQCDGCKNQVGQANGCQGTICDGHLGVVGHEMGQAERLQGSMTSSERDGGREIVTGETGLDLASMMATRSEIVTVRQVEVWGV